MRILTFSRSYPPYHPKAGQPTFFVDKIWLSLAPNVSGQMWGSNNDYVQYLNNYYKTVGNSESFLLHPEKFQARPKHHTIRGGDRWKVGDKFSPRVWSGKPYRSKQIEIGPPIEIKKIFPFELHRKTIWVNHMLLNSEEQLKLATNDGLAMEDFKAWFTPDHFTGQIICWNQDIVYPE